MFESFSDQSIDWRAAAGIVFGAAISAVVSYSLQRTSFAEARAQKEHDGLETKKAQAYSLLFKLMRILSNLAILQRTIYVISFCEVRTISSWVSITTFRSEAKKPS
jgi:hypothetical protein